MNLFVKNSINALQHKLKTQPKTQKCMVLIILMKVKVTHTHMFVERLHFWHMIYLWHEEMVPFLCIWYFDVSHTLFILLSHNMGRCCLWCDV